MRAPVTSLFAATLLLLASGTTVARTQSLTSWADDELAPYLAEQLGRHPRFKGETVVFVALDNGAPAPVTNALVLALRDRLVDRLVDQPGITIGRQNRSATAGRNGTASDCSRDAVHYYLGLEVTELLDDQHRVTLRVLDAGDRSWVAGIGKSWEGRLSRAQQKGLGEVTVDEYFRGSRDVPFSAAQPDLLAAHLARDLGCQLLRQVAGEYVIGTETTAANAASLAGALELVRNNLAGNPAVQVTASSAAANAHLTGKAHPIAGDLHQYWVTIAPVANTDLPAISVSTYVRLPATPSTPTPVVQTRPAASAPSPSVPLPVNTASNELITPLRVVEPRQRRSCYRGGSADWQQGLVPGDFTIARGECFLLRSRADRDASVFLLNFQVIHGLVSLSGRRCGNGSPWIDVRAGQALQFPSAGDRRVSASAWQGHAGLESFYAIAVNDRRAANDIAALVEQLPSRCSLSAVQGLTGNELAQWMKRLNGVVDRWQHVLDWQAVRVEHVG